MQPSAIEDVVIEPCNPRPEPFNPRPNARCGCTRVSYDAAAGCEPGICISRHTEIYHWIKKYEPIEDET